MKRPIGVLLLFLALAPAQATTDTQTDEYLHRLSNYYYCLSREGLKSFQCEATASFSGQLPKGIEKDWQGFNWQNSRCVFNFSYTGGEVMPILTFLSNGGDPEATPARMRRLTNLANALLLSWGSFDTVPLFGKGKIGAGVSVENVSPTGFTIVDRRKFSTITVDFDDKALAKNFIVHTRFGNQEIKLWFVHMPQGALLEHAEMDIREKGLPPINVDLVMQYALVQGFQMPSRFIVYERSPGQLFQAVYDLSNYQIQRSDPTASDSGHRDSEIVSAASESPTARHFLWRVRSPNSAATVYLLGSIHIRPNVPLQVPEVVERSFQSSDAVGFECDLSKQAQFDQERQPYFEQHCTYPVGDSLQKHIQPDEWQKIRFLLKLWGVPVATAVQYKPYILEQLAFQKPSPKNAYITKFMGIDNIFLRKAQAAKKPVFGMEFWYEGFKDLDGLNDHDQVHFLLGDSKNNHNHFRHYEEILADWKCGNTVDLDALTNQDVSPEDKDIADKLISVRNQKWLFQLDRIFQTHSTYFIVVGSAHLVGDQGLPHLLSQKGYTVEQL